LKPKPSVSSPKLNKFIVQKFDYQPGVPIIEGDESPRWGRVHYGDLRDMEQIFKERGAIVEVKEKEDDETKLVAEGRISRPAFEECVLDLNSKRRGERLQKIIRLRRERYYPEDMIEVIEFKVTHSKSQGQGDKAAVTGLTPPRKRPRKSCRDRRHEVSR
jgi:hypothetical protein